MFDFLKKKSTLKEFVQSRGVRFPFTKDEYRLETKRYHWVLEYGELMQGLPGHKIIGVTPITPAFTDERFSLWIRKEDEVAVALKLNFSNFRVPKAKVAGELYPLTKNEIINLDMYRQNGVFFHRKLIRVRIPDGSTVLAWVYVGTEELKKTIKWDVDFYRCRDSAHYAVAGTLTDTRPWLGCYYHFNASNFTRRDPKCYLHFHRGLSEPKQNSRVA